MNRRADRKRRTAHLLALAQSEPRQSASPMRVAFRLPWPPSVNTYWRSIMKGPLAGRVLISERGRNYRVAVGEAVLRQCVPRWQLTGKMSINVMACPPDRRKRDLDNLWKSFLDALQHAGVYRDDGEFDDMRIFRGPIMSEGWLHVEIVELPGAGATIAMPLECAMPSARAAFEASP